MELVIELHIQKILTFFKFFDICGGLDFGLWKLAVISSDLELSGYIAYGIMVVAGCSMSMSQSVTILKFGCQWTWLSVFHSW